MKKILFLLLLSVNSYAQKSCHGKFTLCDAVRYEFNIPTTDSALVTQLALPDQDVFIKKDFELTAFGALTVNARVWSDGSKLISNYHMPDSLRQFRGFLMMQTGSSIDGVQVIGYDSSHKWISNLLANGIFVNAPNVSISNCVVWAFSQACIWLRSSTGVHITGCYLGGTYGWGYSYGIWTASVTTAQSWHYIDRCVFDLCRESYGCSGSNCMQITNCILLPTAGGIERHSSTGGRGGYGTVLVGNYFLGDQGWWLTIPIKDTAHVWIIGNFTTLDSTGTGVRTDASWPDFAPIMYNNVWSYRPQCYYNVDSIRGPEVFISFTQPADSFELQYGATGYVSGVDHCRLILPEGSVMLGVRAWSNGLPTLWNFKKIVVGNALCVSFKTVCDTCDYEAQLLVDGAIVARYIGSTGGQFRTWTLPALSGTHTITMQLVTLRTTTAQVYFTIDDFDNAGKVSIGNFETDPCGGGWRYYRSNGENCDCREFHSGLQGHTFKRTGLSSPAGARCGLYQKFIF